MAKYLLTYRGGGMPETEAEQAAVMQAWEAWYGTLGAAVADPGNPCGAGRTIAADGSVGPVGASTISGYTIISAEDLDAAVGHAKGCPILAAGGSVEVSETFDVM